MMTTPPQRVQLWYGVTLVTVLLALAAPAVVFAQESGFQLDQYRAAETPEDGFAVSRPGDLGHLDVGGNGFGVGEVALGKDGPS